MTEPSPEAERGPRRVYANDAIEVLWEPKLCIHVRNCVRGLQRVFDPQRRPWVHVDAADPDAIAATIQTCPTGALHFRRSDGGAQEEPQPETTIEPRPNGPLFVRGRVRIVDEEGRLIREDTRLALCRCGASANKPFCDGSHRKIGFTTAAASSRASSGPQSPNGPPPQPDGRSLTAGDVPEGSLTTGSLQESERGALMNEHKPADEQHQQEDQLVHDQEHKGYGYDEGEREEILEREEEEEPKTTF